MTGPRSLSIKKLLFFPEKIFFKFFVTFCPPVTSEPRSPVTFAPVFSLANAAQQGYFVFYARKNIPREISLPQDSSLFR